MKRDLRLQALDLRLLTFASLCIVNCTALALTENPYNGIVGRNAFALKPPTPAAVAAPPVVAPPGIELQGITTILGRPQVLLKIKLPPKPPEPAKDQSFVLDVGQREGDVEVLAIDMVAGTVRLKNQGNDLALSMKENAAKPAAGPAIPGAMPTPTGLPSIPAPNLGMPPGTANPAVRPGGGTSVSPMGGSSPALPTRSLRSGAAANPTGAAANATGAAANATGGLSASGNAQSYQPPNTGLTVEEQMAILAVQKEANADGTAALLPPIPPKYRPK